MKTAQRTLNMKTTAVLAAVLFLLVPFFVIAQEGDSAGAIRQGDILCFGTPDGASGFDGRWLVLDSGHTSTGEDGLFLVSLGLIGDEKGEPLLFRDIGDVTVSFSNRGEAWAAAHPGATVYQGSDIQQWCKAFLESRFSEAERQAMLPTFKSDEGIAIPGFSIPLPGAAGGTVDFDPAEDILSGDRLFLLSAEEVTAAQYGFGDNRSRVALYKGEAQGYWLRSPHIPTFPLDVGFVFSFGAVMDYPVNGKSMFTMPTYARPACNLDRACIAGLEKLAEDGGTAIWRVSFQGDAPNGQAYDLALPQIGEVPDVQRIISIALPAAGALLIALVGLTAWLIVRHVRKKRVLSRCGKNGLIPAEEAERADR